MSQPRRRGSRLRQAVWGPTSSRIRRTTSLREPAIKAYRSIARAALTGPPPKVFANSVPKAGTHLLTQLLAEVPQLWFTGDHVIRKDFYRPAPPAPGRGLDEFNAAFAARMAKIRDGQYLTAHLGAIPGVQDTLDRLGFVHLLMIRDPRDIIVSRAFYRAKNERLDTHEWFANLDDEARLMAAITGGDARDSGEPLLSIASRLERYLPWLDDPRVVVMRFEDLVGAAGGGTEQAQRDTIRRVLAACRRPDDDVTVERIAEKVFNTRSATFRRGAIGDWRNHLGQAHLDALERVAPGAVAAFGYASASG
jgi:hypothetical protein